MHRFFGEFNFNADTIKISEDHAVAHQLRDVLKMKKGDQVALFNEKGEEAFCRIDIISKKELLLRIDRIEQKNSETERHTHLFCAVLKKDNFELVVQKATEVGVTDIHPIITDRTIKQGLRFDRLERIAIEATEQSGRMRVPTVHEIEALDDAVNIAEQMSGLHICLDMSAETIQSVLSKKSETVCVFIGPEGGWSDAERKLFQEKEGWKMVSLGDGVYRAETAAIIAGYLVANN